MSDSTSTARTDDREKVFADIRKALDPLHKANKQTPYPEWDEARVICHAHPEFGDLWDLFAYRAKNLHGTPLKGWAELLAYLKAQGETTGYCAPELLDEVKAAFGEAAGDFELDTTYDRSRIDEYTFGITRAAGAIAESGTLILKDESTSSRLGALAPWMHIAILRRADLCHDIPTAVKNFGDDPSIIWATGPSKTADVEGILIEGVHGPGLQIVCLVD